MLDAGYWMSVLNWGGSVWVKQFFIVQEIISFSKSGKLLAKGGRRGAWGNMKHNFVWVLAVLMLIGLSRLAAMSLATDDSWIRKADMLTIRAFLYHCWAAIRSTRSV